MGGSVSRAVGCFTHHQHGQHHDKVGASFCDPSDGGLGHSYCYMRTLQGLAPAVSPTHSCHTLSQCVVSAEVCDKRETYFKTISGASISANTSTPRTVSCQEQFNSFTNVLYDRAAAFESSASFSFLPLQLVPRGLSHSGSMSGSLSGPFSVSQSGQASGPLERGFLSGPIERGVMSGPLERGFLSGPLERGCISGPIEEADRNMLSAALSGPYATYFRRRRRHLVQLIRTLSNPVKRVLSRSLSNTSCSLVKIQRLLLAPPKPGQKDVLKGGVHTLGCGYESLGLDFRESHSLQWAQGKAGEDRVHVVLSEEHGWLFIGIYDGFNGPDAPDFLLSNLYGEVYRKLHGLLWDVGDTSGGQDANSDIEGRALVQVNELCSQGTSDLCIVCDRIVPYSKDQLIDQAQSKVADGPCQVAMNDIKQDCDKDSIMGTERSIWSNGSILSFNVKNTVSKSRQLNKRSILNSEQQKRKGLEKLDEKRKQDESECGKNSNAGPDSVLQALARALASTERAFLEMADQSMEEMPELALMGSCVLVMLMKGKDVYVMNVGDSRAILAKLKHDPGRECSTYRENAACEMVNSLSIEPRDSQLQQELERIIEEPARWNFEECHTAGPPETSSSLNALQLSSDHSTSIDEEARRIKLEHPDDIKAITNERVKGRLKVTRAFGAGFLKLPRWNDALLEMFRIDYVGIAPYVTCTPALHHHILEPDDRFLVLSSDGLYQYLSNNDVVAHVEWFMDKYPDGDPAQYLIESLLFRAAKKAGMDFHQLLDIPHGDRRSYHDDISVVVISFDGRIWQSFGSVDTAP